jgi:hypothetical protein
VTVALADIKKDLPTWPDDVIEQWLLYLADREDTGWPPPDPLGDHAWTYILSDKPVAWWSKVEWKLQKMDCSLAKLSKDTRESLSLVGRLLDIPGSCHKTLSVGDTGISIGLLMNETGDIPSFDPIPQH